MKFKFVAIGVLLIMVLGLTACSSGNITVQFTCDDFTNRQHLTHYINASEGDTIEITLCANPTTGFEWSEVWISDAPTIELVAREFHAPGSNDNPPAPGTPGIEELTFKVLEKGESQVYMEYSQPWDGGEKAVWTYEMTVTVK